MYALYSIGRISKLLELLKTQDMDWTEDISPNRKDQLIEYDKIVVRQHLVDLRCDVVEYSF